MNRMKTITLGDKIFARVTRNGRTIYNFVSEKVSNMTDLIRQLREAMSDFHGLVMIHIRNYHQGWGEERPLMLYATKPSYFSNIELSHDSLDKQIDKKQPFPWETH